MTRTSVWIIVLITVTLGCCSFQMGKGGPVQPVPLAEQNKQQVSVTLPKGLSLYDLHEITSLLTSKPAVVREADRNMTNVIHFSVEDSRTLKFDVDKYIAGELAATHTDIVTRDSKDGAWKVVSSEASVY